MSLGRGEGRREKQRHQTFTKSNSRHRNKHIHITTDGGSNNQHEYLLARIPNMMTRTRSQGKAKSRVSFNPVVHEKPLENGLSDDDEVEEEVEEVEEDEVAKELEMESASADETDEDETLTAQEARSLSGQFKQMKRGMWPLSHIRLSLTALRPL